MKIWNIPGPRCESGMRPQSLDDAMQLGGDDEDLITAAYDSAVATFWSDARYLARQHGYVTRQEGRSGGWLVPVKIDGEHPEVMLDVEERKRFVAFEEAIMELLAATPNTLAEYIKEELAEREAHTTRREVTGATDPQSDSYFVESTR